MQIDWYRSFMEAAKARSLSKAADKLSLTQPAISKHIRHLEEAYSVELFRRGVAGVDLTEAGRHFLERIGPVVDALETIKTEMRQFTEQSGYTLGSLPSVATHVLPGRLRAYHEAGYAISVQIRLSSSELVEGLQEGQYDAVLIDAAYAGTGLWTREMFREGYVAIMPPDHPLGTRASLTATDLQHESFVFARHCDSPARFKAVAEKHGSRLDVKLEVDHNDYLLGVVAVGTGITVMPELFRAQAERLGLCVVPIAEAGLERTIALAARSAATGTQLYRLLAGWQPATPLERVGKG